MPKLRSSLILLRGFLGINRKSICRSIMSSGFECRVQLATYEDDNDMLVYVIFFTESSNLMKFGARFKLLFC